MLSTAASVICGYFSAVLFQALYNIEKRGGFIIDSSTGATFYGGLIGGAACFLILYFAGGAITLKNREHIRSFFDVADIAAASICIAHALGRLGCLMAGCCHGGQTDAWYGIYMMAQGVKVVPIQLFEALFLLALFAFFVWRLSTGKRYGLPIYMATYGVWRFAIEYARGDNRGSTLVDFLSPSQLVAVLMIIGAVLVFLFQRRLVCHTAEKAEGIANEE